MPNRQALPLVDGDRIFGSTLKTPPASATSLQNRQAVVVRRIGRSLLPLCSRSSHIVLGGTQPDRLIPRSRVWYNLV
jgi:hypothetical protein